MITRLQSQRGFALIELLAAIVMINIGILAILLTLNSGQVTLRRSAELSTASAVADKHMERFRALQYNAIYLDTASLAATDAIYKGDTSYTAHTDPERVNQACSPLTTACMPSQTIPGPDGRTYRIDTYIVWKTPTDGAGAPNGDPVKQATVVVRRSTGSTALARTVSIFGENF
jgi:type II secretory pathway pseudopilin PulG